MMIKTEEEAFYVGFTKSLGEERNSLERMKAAFTPFDPPAESLGSATETLRSGWTPSQPLFSVDKVLDTQRAKPSNSSLREIYQL